MQNGIRKVLLASLATLGFAVAAHAGHHETAEKTEGKGDIVEVAVSAGQFETLVAALKAADLVTTLQGDGPFTVFAPNDDAFAELPAGTIEHLLKPENRDQLVAILTYHVVPGKIYAAEVVKLDSATTVNGADIMIHTDDQGVRVNDARVIQTDVGASNGVIHIIDTVILPK